MSEDDPDSGARKTYRRLEYAVNAKRNDANPIDSSKGEHGKNMYESLTE